MRLQAPGNRGLIEAMPRRIARQVICSAASYLSIYQRVGTGKENARNSKAKCMGRLQIYHEFEFHRHLNRKVAWVGTA